MSLKSQLCLLIDNYYIGRMRCSSIKVPAGLMETIETKSLLNQSKIILLSRICNS
jgi:hypothetical protein